MPAEIREYQHGRLKMIRHLVFDGWELIAQQTQQFTLNLDNRVELMAGEVETQYAVSAPTGEPLALFDPAGKRVWRRPKQSLYGLRLSGHGENPQLDPGLRFAGQLFDEESGLFYNRFRYYLPEGCCYLSTDPIGLFGGENTYRYVQNPTGWVDPLGLSSTVLNSRIGGFVGDGLEAHHLIPEEIWKKNQSFFDALGMDMDGKGNGRLMAGSESKRIQLNDALYHRGSHPQYSSYVGSRIERIKYKWKPGINDDATIKRVEKLQSKLNAKIREGDAPRSKTKCSKIG